MDPGDLREVLGRWFADRRTSNVRLLENLQPKKDPDQRYEVVYEVVFEPESLEKARIEIWLTKEGEYAIGIEQRRRVARRLGVPNRRQGFAAGHEPFAMSEESILIFLDIVAKGKIAIQARCLPIWGLGKTQALLTEDAKVRLQKSGYSHRTWEQSTDPLPEWFYRVVSFVPW